MKAKSAVAIGMILLFAVAVSACAIPPGGDRSSESVSAADRPQEQVTLMLHAGAGIREAASELTAEFESRTGIRVDATYGTCGQLFAQISAAPHRGDLYMPGAMTYVQQAIDEELALEETKRDLSSFVPVIFVQKGNPKGIKTVQDLTQPGLRVGFGDERSTVIGKRAMKILEKNEIPYEEIEPNIVYKAATSNPLGVAIQTGAVDAVITWDANARHFEQHGDIIEIPKPKNAPSTIPVLMLAASRHPQEARKFIEFAASEEGRKIMQEQGYSPLEPSPAQ
jgi:molybdate transport system substrate-binding protein